MGKKLSKKKQTENINQESILLSNEEFNKINEKIEKYLCKIININNKNNSGFLCKIPFPDENNLLSVLITNNIILNENKILEIILSNNESKKLLINEYRKIYTNEKYNNITIIEIVENDNIDTNLFAEIDNQIFKLDLEWEKNKYLSFNQNEKYFLCYLKNKDDNFIIKHISFSQDFSSGNPIINQINCKIVGIYIEDKEYKYLNIKLLKDSINDFNEKFKFKNISKHEQSEQINKIEFIDEIKIEYMIGEEKEIRIFGDDFVNNNKDLCKIIINEKEEELCTNYNTENIELNNNIFEIKLKGINKITDMSYMFCFCDRLISLPDLPKINISNITNLSNMFCSCELLTSLPDISNWNISNVNDISGMFSGCSSLISIPDISKWNTNNVTDFNNLFSGCESLECLPDISKWNTNNVTNMSNLFSKCSSILSIPDISNWNTTNVSNMNNLFSNCSKLITLTSISNWDMSNVINITRMFYKCKSLISLPDLSKWNTSNVKHMNSLFEECSSLKTLPDISKWNTSNVTSMFSMFSGCQSLISLPDISNWNTKNVTDMNSMFCECSSLDILPDISKWNTNNVTDMGEMFDGCNPNLNIPDKFK